MSTSSKQTDHDDHADDPEGRSHNMSVRATLQSANPHTKAEGKEQASLAANGHGELETNKLKNEAYKLFCQPIEDERDHLEIEVGRYVLHELSGSPLDPGSKKRSARAGG